MLTEQRKTEVIELCKKLIASRSYSGEETGVAEILREFMKEHGFDGCQTDSCGNVIGRITGNRDGARILFDGHMDTVPADHPEAWKYSPFTPVIEGGKLYGRGASDMKGAIAAFMTAAACFAQDYGRDFSGEIYVAGVVHEECFEGVAARSVSEIVRPDYVVIGEASSLNIKTGQQLSSDSSVDGLFQVARIKRRCKVVVECSNQFQVILLFPLQKSRQRFNHAGMHILFYWIERKNDVSAE